jgi:hypothetical protein
VRENATSDQAACKEMGGANGPEENERKTICPAAKEKRFVATRFM